MSKLLKKNNTWLITGCAGFIGSNLLEYLLLNNQRVVGIDNFSTGYQSNLDQVKESVGNTKWKNLSFLDADLRDLNKCLALLNRIKGGLNFDFILHQAAIGSVPRSIKDPIFTHENNVDVFVNILEIARSLSIPKLVYASSSSVYGDEVTLPKREQKIGKLLSPYAATKYINEIYADIYSSVYNISITGLRYFNVFGPRQDPGGPYAAVIPKWIQAFIDNSGVIINGDGKTTRDFCYIDNVVQANIRSALINQPNHLVHNIAFGERTSLEELTLIIIDNLRRVGIRSNYEIRYGDFREGDIRHSLADISSARENIGYLPEYDLSNGMKKYIDWYINN